jgi:N,N'-diacetyllegionaminate synthase
MSKKVVIIAEAGVNHNGDIEIAKSLIDAAANAGADFVKFQTFKANKIVSPLAQKAVYQKANLNDEDDNQFNMLKKLELQEEHHHILVKHCTLRNISFLSTGFDEESLDFLDSLNIPLYKIPSGEITNKPYLEHVASKGKPVILSTGMANMEEIQVSIDLLIQKGIQKENITVLHCNTEYPTPMQDVNLKAMLYIHESLGVQVGYSDHTLGIEVPIAAVALGANVIEKHFTLDRNMKGPDHVASLEPHELKAMVMAIRNVELAVSGNGIKLPSQSEQKNLSIARKSIHLAKSKKQGDIISADDLIMLRPGDGISPMEIDKVIGKQINQSVEAGAKLSWSQIIR